MLWRVTDGPYLKIVFHQGQLINLVKKANSFQWEYIYWKYFYVFYNKTNQSIISYNIQLYKYL